MTAPRIPRECDFIKSLDLDNVVHYRMELYGQDLCGNLVGDPIPNQRRRVWTVTCLECLVIYEASR